MNECWNFFRYACSEDVPEIMDIIRSNKKWFSHLTDKHFEEKINRKECIYESGILITFKFTTNINKIGDFVVPKGNTILEQIAKKKSFSKNSFAEHVFTKFLNCSTGELYLAVNVKNERAINFYKKMKMYIISNTKLDNSLKDGFIFKSKKLNN